MSGEESEGTEKNREREEEAREINCWESECAIVSRPGITFYFYIASSFLLLWHSSGTSEDTALMNQKVHIYI